jgi:hypothetical protein
VLSNETPQDQGRGWDFREGAVEKTIQRSDGAVLGIPATRIISDRDDGMH